MTRKKGENVRQSYQSVNCEFWFYPAVELQKGPGKRGVSGGGSATLTTPYTIECDADSCSPVKFGAPETSAEIDISACAFGFCFSHTF